MLNLIRDLGKNHGKHIILSTHLLPDVERTCDNVVVIARGKKAFQGSLQSLLASEGEEITYQIQTTIEETTFAEILEQNGFKVDVDPPFILCRLRRDDLRQQIRIFKLAKEHKTEIRLFRPYRKSLEGMFLELLK